MDNVIVDISRLELRNEMYGSKPRKSFRTFIFDKRSKTMINQPVPVEQRFSKEYNNKKNGWPASDISRLISASSVVEIQNLVQKMASVKDQQVDGKPLTVEQKFAAIKPRLCDTPLERERYFNYMNDTFGRSANDLFDLSEKIEKEDVQRTTPEDVE